MDHNDFMKMALELAARGAGYTSPNPMVGAVLVKNGQVVGRGYHRKLGAAHAEVEAIKDAGTQAKGATLYVTLEPCNHHGRTPPCTEAVIRAGIRKVVMAMQDPNPHVTGGGIERLQAAGIEVVCGPGREQAERLNEAFIKFIRTGRPFVILKAAMTLDGRIATRSGDARWVTGPVSRALVHELRHRVDAIMVGRATVRADDPSLTTRLNEGRGKDPIRVILDSGLNIDPAARVLHLDSKAPTWIACGRQVDQKKVEQLERLGAECLPVKLRDGRIDLEALLEILGRRQVSSLLVEGGATVTGRILAGNMVDKVMFFYAPKILTGDDGVPLSRGRGPDRMADCLKVKNPRVSRVGEDILLEGYL